MGHTWLHTIDESPLADVVGGGDVDAACPAASTGALAGTYLSEVMLERAADTVLGEKPLATTLPEGSDAGTASADTGYASLETASCSGHHGALPPRPSPGSFRES